ncbi:MAG: hypothetical protein ATN35_05205 [Epulopiscium sp. Nele67-Bin004]|nr:MAG: hypothetical protein ATN35_05205 [Epulopiscium sp. Nele67-Bin004]
MLVEFVLEYILHTLSIAIPLFIVYLFFFRNKSVVHHTTVFYLICLYIITVFRPNMSLTGLSNKSLDTINLTPAVELWKFVKYGYLNLFIYNFVGNIAWFIPLGILLPIHGGKFENFWTTVKCGFYTSLSIEILQFIYNTGISDIDDLIINTLGTIVGFGMYQAYKSVQQKNSSFIQT